MEGPAVAVCEILKYLIIHQRCETAGVSKGALLEGQLVISIEALNSKHQANTLHCVTTIAAAGSIYGGLVLKKFLKGVHTLLSTHLSAILRESHSVVQDCIQAAVDRALEQHHQAVKAHQKLQASLSVAVNSIMSIMTGSTNSSFRNTCLQTLQAADTQEFGTKLHKSFHEVTQHRFLYHCSHEVKQQLLPEKNEAEQNTEETHENSSLELLAGTGEQTENKRLKRGSQAVEETRAFRSAGALSPTEAASRRAEPTAAPLTSSRSRTDPGSGLEDTLWLQEISNLSEWLSSGPGP
uniref:Uncharacterized protein n=1 Tax=Rangifer tarandus platyrhynchus TaxID=3082113 RepID=A0ACB0EXP8_RANTA|nr:unnamed protein product [Rangifer tarandus platyrhynchus]